MKNNLFLSIIKKYRFKSLFFKLFFSIFLVLTILLFLLAVMYIRIYSVKSSNKIQNTQAAAVHSVAIETDNMIESAYSAFHLICSNNTILTYLNETALTPRTLSGQAATFTEITNYVMLNSSYLDSIYLYKCSNDYVLSKSMSGFGDNFADMNWYDKYCKANKADTVFYRKTSIYNAEKEYITVCCNIYSEAGVSGVLVFNFCIKNVLSLIDFTKYESFSLNDSAGKIIFSTNSEQINTIVLTPKENQYSCISGNKFYVSEKLAKNSYFVNFVFHQDKAIQIVPDFTKLAILLILAVILVSSVIAYILSYKFYKSIVMIIGIFHQDIGNSISSNEFQYICNHILTIKSDLLDYEKELAKTISSLKKMQITSMQLQINPHFIFNTLNLICTMDIAANKSDTKLSKAVCLLSDILREVIYSNENITNFSHELDYLEKYISLQNIKYNNQFQYTKQIDPQTYYLTCAKFILQPIVENAFKHGIQHSISRKFEITLKSYINENNFIIEVHNNGAGIPTNRLVELQETMQNNSSAPSAHIGMLNVNSRIKLLFGEQYGISISSDCSGVCVKITLPVIPYKS